jgi:citrate lyase subunit beta / citryl-CoA lyase
MENLVASARTLLFVPAIRPDRYAKALGSGADCIIIDLEDAVADSDKVTARERIASNWASLDAGRVVIRINAHDSEYFTGDVDLCARLGVQCVMLPKAHAASAISETAARLGSQVALLPIIESAAGFAALDSIARAPCVIRLAFGNLDFSLDLGMQCGPDEAELGPVRMGLALASRNAGLAPPIDGVTLDTQGDEPVREATWRARRFGFSGKLCIHPRQVRPVHDALAPSQQELSWAQDVVNAAARSNGSAIKLDGKMVDRPIIEAAHRTIARAARQ